MTMEKNELMKLIRGSQRLASSVRLALRVMDTFNRLNVPDQFEDEELKKAGVETWEMLWKYSMVLERKLDEVNRIIEMEVLE